jgi:hypothetical protein
VFQVFTSGFIFRILCQVLPRAVCLGPEHQTCSADGTDLCNPKGQTHRSPEMLAHQTWTLNLGIPLQILVSGQQSVVTIDGVDVLPWLGGGGEVNEVHSTESGVWYEGVAEGMCGTAWCVTGVNSSWDIA